MLKLTMRDGAVILLVDRVFIKQPIYNLGIPKREAVVGADSVHGYKEMPQVAFIEGEVTDRADIDLQALCEGDDMTVTLELANSKVITLRNAWFAGDGTGNSEEGNIAVRWEGLSADEVK